MRVWFAGGGTGGHLYPALAIARALVREEPAVRPFFIGALRGIERDILPASEFEHVLLDLHPLYRSAVWRNSRTIAGAFGVWREISRRRRGEVPRSLVATGGYAAGVALLHAAAHRVPIVLQEQNSHPGLTTRFFSRFASQIHLGFPEAAAHLRPRAGVSPEHSGNPIEPPPESRPPRNGAAARWGFERADAPVVLVFGGSQGARAVNEAVAGWVASGRAADCNVLWVTGKASHEQFARLDSARVRVLPYVSPMAEAYAASRLAVARAGAMSTAELCAWGIPAVLVPLPTAAADHQTSNAAALAAAGAAAVLPQRELTADSLAATVGALLADRARLEAMTRAALARSRPDAARQIARRVVTLLHRSRR